MSFIRGADPSGRWASLNLLRVNTSLNCPSKFLCLIWFRFGQTTTISLFQGWDSLAIFPLGIRISVEVPRVCPDVTSQVIDIQIVLLFNLSFDFLSQFLKPSFQLLLPVFFAFAWGLFLFTNHPPYPRCNPRNWACRSASFDGMCLSAASWIKEAIRSKSFWTERELEWPLKYFSIAKFKASFLIEP